MNDDSCPDNMSDKKYGRNEFRERIGAMTEDTTPTRAADFAMVVEEEWPVDEWASVRGTTTGNIRRSVSAAKQDLEIFEFKQPPEEHDDGREMFVELMRNGYTARQAIDTILDEPIRKQTMVKDKNNTDDIDIEPLDTNQTREMQESTFSVWDDKDGQEGPEGYIGTSREWDHVPLPRSGALGPVIDRVIEHAEDLLNTPMDLDVDANTRGGIKITVSHTIQEGAIHPDNRYHIGEEVYYENTDHTIQHRYYELDTESPDADYRVDEYEVLERLAESDENNDDETT